MSAIPDKLQTAAGGSERAMPWLDESLAPNGRAVRENFQAWFRDSKVVDPSGAPLVLFHGSKTRFNAFDHDRIDSINEGVGFYFTDNRQVANGYGEALEVCLSLQNPMSYDRPKFSQAVMRKVIQRMAELQAEDTGEDIADGLLSNFGDVRDEGITRVVAAAARMADKDDEANDQICSFFHAGVGPQYILKAFHEVTGHDGIMANGFSNCGEGENRIYVAWFSEQIKSVVDNSGLYLRESPEIRDAAAAKQLALGRQAAAEVESSTRAHPKP